MKKIEQLLAMHLLKDIPAVNQQDRSDIVRFMLGQPVRRSMDALTTSLAKSSVELGSTLSAVLRCQWLNIQQLMKEINPDNIHGKLHAFSQCVAHFSELQASIVAAFERNWHTLLDKEIFERVMAQCRLQWASEKTVRLHNYFHEMPVTATAKYIDSSGTQLQIKASEEVGRVFSCSPDMQDIWISCSDEKYVFQVSMVQARANNLTLDVRSVEEAKGELRSDVRIQPEHELSIKMGRHGIPFVARMLDISFTGIGLVIDEEIELIRGEELACVFQVGETKYFLEATVRWVSKHEGTICTGLKFKSLGPFSEQLRKFIFGQQQLIIKRLKKLSAPGWM